MSIRFKKHPFRTSRKPIVSTLLCFLLTQVFLISACKKTVIPSSPSSISGAQNLCPGETNITYSIQPVSGATYYLWTVPDGSKILSGQGTTSIVIEFGKHSGNLTVKACNDKEDSQPTSLKITQGGVPGAWCRQLDFAGGIRTNAVGFAIGNKGYIGTGVDVSAGKYRDFWEFDPESNAWTQKADFGGGKRFDAVGFAIANKGYIGTGYDGNTRLKDFWEYDPNSNQWTIKANFGGGKRESAFGFSIGTKGYLGSGVDSNIAFVSDLWEYNVQLDSWTQKSAVISRQAAVAFSIGNYGYVGLGSGLFTPQNDFWKYDPNADQWTQLTSFPSAPRFASTTFVINNMGYLVGGYDTHVNFNGLFKFNPTTDLWDSISSFPGEERAYGIGFSIGNRGYFGIGSQGTNGTIGLNDFWVYGGE